jgi:hypothetical protein
VVLLVEDSAAGVEALTRLHVGDECVREGRQARERRGNRRAGVEARLAGAVAEVRVGAEGDRLVEVDDGDVVAAGMGLVAVVDEPVVGQAADAAPRASVGGGDLPFALARDEVRGREHELRSDEDAGAGADLVAVLVLNRERNVRGLDRLRGGRVVAVVGPVATCHRRDGAREDGADGQTDNRGSNHDDKFSRG